MNENLNRFTGINAKDTIKCAIALDDDMYSKHGLKVGFNYEMLRYLAADTKKKIIIRNSHDGENYFDSLRNGAIDILIASSSDSSSFVGLLKAKTLDKNSIWLVHPKEITSGVKTINHWIGTIVNTKVYSDVRLRFYSTYDPFKRLECGLTAHQLTPYDGLIKKYAAELGWDWRLLAAIIYQESKFSINSESHRGATGLMQIMPRTAHYYGVTNLFDPEENLKAGVAHLSRLQRHLKAIPEEDLCNFVLASYNAGEGRIADCRVFTEHMNLDKNKWEVVASTIPLMNNDEILQIDTLKHGKFKGIETLNYVDRVNLIYNAFCEIHPSH